MKKIVLLLSLTIIFSGCTKQYSSIDKYKKDMQAVRNSFPAYTLEVSQTIPKYDLKYKSYVKDDKWVTEVSKDNGVSNFVTLVSSGKDLCYYSKDSDFAILLPVEKLLIDKTRKNKSDKIWMLNPIANLFYWYDGRGIFDSLNLIVNDVDTNRKKYDVGTSQAKISKNLTKMNGFDCRMVTFGNNEFGREACISEKYGIAVYSKLKTKNSKNSPIEIISNVTSIDVNDISDSLVKLPKDKSKITRRELEAHRAITNQTEDETMKKSSEFASEYYDKKDFETANAIRENRRQVEKWQEIDSEQYYCPSEYGGYNMNTDIYKPKDDCSAWNDDFWKKSDPEIYTRCLANKQKAKQKYEQGLCVPIVKKEHKFGSVNCTVEVAEKYNKVISKSCQSDMSCMKTNSCTSDLDPYMKKIDELYKETPINNSSKPKPYTASGLGNYMRDIQRSFHSKLSDVDLGTKTVVVNLDISRNGNISNITIKRSSGNTVLDNKVKDCIRKSSPLSTFPSSYIKNMINVDYTVSKSSSGVSVTN